MNLRTISGDIDWIMSEPGGFVSGVVYGFVSQDLDTSETVCMNIATAMSRVGKHSIGMHAKDCIVQITDDVDTSLYVTHHKHHLSVFRGGVNGAGIDMSEHLTRITEYGYVPRVISYTCDTTDAFNVRAASCEYAKFRELCATFKCVGLVNFPILPDVGGVLSEVELSDIAAPGQVCTSVHLVYEERQRWFPARVCFTTLKSDLLTHLPIMNTTVGYTADYTNYSWVDTDNYSEL